MGRTLDDLYVLGKPHTVDDGNGDPVDVWMQKMNPLDADKTLRRANAAKARMLMFRVKEDSDEWLELYADVCDYSDEALKDYLIAEDLSEYTQSREAELAADEEWSKDDYLQGLRDAWDGTDGEPGLRDAAEDDEERVRCLAELRRFTEKLDPLVEAERARLKDDFKGVPIEQLRKDAVSRFLEVRATSKWITEFHRCEIAYGVRNPQEHGKYYFAKADGEPDFERVSRLAPETFADLSNAYQRLTVSPAEGKDSPEAPSSSQPSGLSGEEETVPPSGPPAAVR